MTMVLVGLNHKSASVELRERLAIPNENVKEALSYLIKTERVKECAIISTCNRVEVIAEAGVPCQANIAIKSFLASFSGLSLESFKNNMYVLYETDVVSHLFKVVSGLDSLVLGEPQIFGQIKDSYALASKFKMTGFILNKLFHRAFYVAKKVRSETGLGKYSVSIPSVAVDLANQIFSSLKQKSVLVIGAGKMGEVASLHFKKNGVSRLMVANRSLESAKKLAQKLSGEPYPISEVYNLLVDTDVVLSAITKDEYLITLEGVKNSLKNRSRGPLFLIDIGLPRTIDPNINSMNQVFLYDIDDLQSVVEINKKAREKEAKIALKIIKNEVDRFVKTLNGDKASFLIGALRKKLEETRTKELNKTLSKLRSLSENEKKSISILTESLINKILYDPIITLKHSNNDEMQSFLGESLKILFNLEVDEKSGEDLWKESESVQEKVHLP